MKSYRTTQARRKLRGRNQISDRYWLAFRRLYGPANLNIPPEPADLNRKADHSNQQDFNHDIPLLEKRL